MKRLLVTLAAIAFCFSNVSCSTDPATGARLFLGASGREWLVIGLNTGKQAAPIALREYEAIRYDPRTSTK